MDSPFMRSARGISNLFLFFDVDVVVWVEGGSDALDISNLSKDTASVPTYDTMFWQILLQKFRPELRFHLKSGGSKSSIVAVANLIVRGEVDKVVVAFDRDFDHAKRTAIRHENVLYTRGYSWENDVYIAEVLKKLITTFCMDRNTAPDLHAEVDESFGKFYRSFKIIARYDYALAAAGLDVCDRSTLEQCVLIRPPQRPQISRKALSGLIRKIRNKHRGVKLLSKPRSDVAKDVHGHTLEKYFLGFCQSLFCAPIDLKLSHDACKRSAISSFTSTTSWKKKSKNYYQRAIFKIVV